MNNKQARLLTNLEQAERAFQEGNRQQLACNLDEARNCYLLALKLHPEFPVAMNNLGLIFQIGGEVSTAERLFRKALKLDPEYAHAHNNLGNVMRDLSFWAEAIA